MACRAPAPPTQEFVVVCLTDEALLTVPGPLMREYEITREIAVLEQPNEDYGWRGLRALDEQPTRYHCQPLSARHRTRASSFAIGPDGQFSIDDRDLWTMFSYNVTKITDYFDHEGKPIEFQFPGTEGKDLHLHHEAHEQIAAEHYVEVAQVIIHKGLRSNTTPFGTGDTWLASRRSRALAALPVLTAPTEPASESSTESAEASTSEDPGAS